MADTAFPKHLEIESDSAGAPKEHLLPKDVNLQSFGLGTWFESLKSHFGYKLLVLLFVVQHLLKGFISAFVGRATPYMYKSYSVPAPQMQIFGSVTSLPWALKPMIGLVSDTLPVCGYSKAPYILGASVVGSLSFLVVGVLPQSYLTVIGLVACMFLINFQLSTCDLLSEAKYAEKIKLHPLYGPDLLTYVWFGLTVGGLLAVLISGFIIESAGPKVVYLIASLPALVVICPVAAGYLEEMQLKETELAEVRRRFLQQREACALCILIFICTASLTFSGIVYADPLTNGILAIVVAVVVIFSFSITLSPVIAKFNAYSMLQSSISLSISGATFYFYTDTPEQYPEGPHFSPFFFNTVMGAIGAICSLFGIYLYRQYMSCWRYRRLLIFTNVVFSCLCVLDILMFKRINVRWGIPDKVLVLGSSVLESVVAQWIWMPQVVIMSYLCPGGMEATMYALLAGSYNLGMAVSSNIGALLLDQLACRPSGAEKESAQFQNLWLASVAATLLPLASVLALIQLVPDASQTENLIGDDSGTGTATKGSLLRQWMSIDEPYDEPRPIPSPASQT